MRSNQVFKLNLLVILTCFNVFCADLLITTSGTYILNDDLLATSADANGAIRIQASFVTLDLNDRMVYQSNSTAGANGIVIDSGLNDVVIKNGEIVNFTRCGVTVNSGCSVIRLQNLSIEGCQIRGIELLGTAANKIVKSEINSCKAFECCTANTADNVITLSACSDVNITDCIFNNNSASAIDVFSIILLDFCKACNIANTKIDGNSSSSAPSAGAFSCIRFNSTGSCCISDFLGRENINTSTTASGNHMMPVRFTGTTALNSSNVFKRCYIINNSASTNAVSYGFNIDNSYNSLLRDCIAISQSATDQAQGFVSNTLSRSVTFDNCISMSNTSTGNGYSSGFYCGGSKGIVNKCLGAYSTVTIPTATGGAYGIRVEASDWQIKESDFFGNTNTASDANSNGIRWNTGSNNVFVQNVAVRNGSTTNTANIAGAAFPAGAQTSSTSATMNTPTAPWTNLSIAS